jgi:hypothetical protein
MGANWGMVQIRPFASYLGTDCSKAQTDAARRNAAFCAVIAKRLIVISCDCLRRWRR